MMTPAEFKAWRKSLGLTQEQAGKAIGKHKVTISAYEKGLNSRGEPAPVPLTVELACKWLAQQWRPLTHKQMNGDRVLIWVPFYSEIFASEFSHGSWQGMPWSAKNPQPTLWQPLPQPPEE